MPIFELPKFAHPDFTNIRVNPKGAVKYNVDTILNGSPRHLWVMGDTSIPVDLMADRAQSHLTTTVAPSLARTAYGKGLNFNGTSNFLSTPGNFSFGGAGTVVAFAQANTSPGANSCITGTGFNDNRLCVQTGGLLEYRVIGGGGNSLTIPAGIAAGRPSILAGGFDGTDIFVYRNREIATLANANTPSIADNLIIGARADGASFFFDGDMYWWAYFDVRLSLGELISLDEDPYQLFEQANVIDYFVPSAVAGGRIMGSIAGSGGLAGKGGMAGAGGGLAA